MSLDPRLFKDIALKRFYKVFWHGDEHRPNNRVNPKWTLSKSACGTVRKADFCKNWIIPVQTFTSWFAEHLAYILPMYWSQYIATYRCCKIHGCFGIYRSPIYWSWLPSLGTCSEDVFQKVSTFHTHTYIVKFALMEFV